MQTTPLRTLAERLIEASKVLLTIEHECEVAVSAIGLNGNGHGKTNGNGKHKPAKRLVKVRAYRRKPTVKSFLAHRPTSLKRKAKSKPRKPMTMTPAAVREHKLQGQYIGFSRNLTPEQRERVKKVQAAKGYEHSIPLAKALNEQRAKRLGVSVVAAKAPA